MRRKRLRAVPRRFVALRRRGFALSFLRRLRRTGVALPLALDAALRLRVRAALRPAAFRFASVQPVLLRAVRRRLGAALVARRRAVLRLGAALRAEAPLRRAARALRRFRSEAARCRAVCAFRLMLFFLRVVADLLGLLEFVFRRLRKLLRCSRSSAALAR